MRHLRKGAAAREERRAGAITRAEARELRGDTAQLEMLIAAGHGEGREATRLRKGLAA